MKHICIFFIRLYRRFVSPIKPKCCRFTPTCSAYAIEAYEKRGFFVGTALTIWRLLRCNPFGRPGHDPVPEKRQKRVPITNIDKGSKEKN
jgi:putative membrane protein insertion efficiency factor